MNVNSYCNQSLSTRSRQWLDMHLNDMSSGTALYVNLILAALIFLSVFCSMLATIKTLPIEVYENIHSIEYLFASIFVIEYSLRLYSAPNRLAYMFSYYGLIDLIAVLPILFLGSNEAFILRLLRTLALLRVLKLLRYGHDLKILLHSLKSSIAILIMLISGIALLATIGGNLIYLLEPERFSSAFDGVWWSLVTMTTVGYGDYVPHSMLGRLLAGGAMIIGIGMFAVVTGLVSSRIIEAIRACERSDCRQCEYSVEQKSLYCSHCGIDNPTYFSPESK